MRKIIAAFIISLSIITASYADPLPKYQWQKHASFPDWKGYTDDTLAMNAMISFTFWRGQGKIYLRVSSGVKSFRAFLNGHSIDTSSFTPGKINECDISPFTVNGTNTLQVSNIIPHTLKNAVEVFIPYPEILTGPPENEGINPEALALISDIISSDVAHGFPGAQLAVIRNGRLVYSNAWGKTDSTNPDSPPVTRETLYDLASVTKVLAVNYAVQKLMTDGLLDVDAKISDILGREYITETITAPYSPVNKNTMREWKSSVTVRDVMCHRAGYPPEIHFHDKNYDLSTFRHNDKARNPLYTGTAPTLETRAKTYRAILTMPLAYQPRTKIAYSDIDYMLMCFVVEKVSGMRLDVYLRENFWRPLGLGHMTYNPLENGFSPENIAATQTDGNTTTRGMRLKFPGLRDYVLRGEVHDEKAYHSMAGISGHAGLFANAEDCAVLLSAMLTGGYGGHEFFSRNVIDTFTATQDKDKGQWGLGWWREGDDSRVYYFGTQAASCAFGHQGFTGTLVMADPSRNLVIAYLTNKLNTPAVIPLSRRKTFAGNWYTASTLGFIAQILGIGIDAGENISGQLGALVSDMAEGSRKLIPEKADKNHPARRNAESKRQVAELWSK